MMYVTIGVIAVLIILSIAALVFNEALSEIPGFMYVVLGGITLLIGAAIYLTVAVPSLANTSDIDGSKTTNASVTQDNMVGLELLEE